MHISDNVPLAYPFFYRPMFEIIEDGWQAFQAESEFSRVSHVSSEWRLSSVNRNFEVTRNMFMPVVHTHCGQSVHEGICKQSLNYSRELTQNLGKGTTMTFFMVQQQAYRENFLHRINSVETAIILL